MFRNLNYFLYLCKRFQKEFKKLFRKDKKII